MKIITQKFLELNAARLNRLEGYDDKIFTEWDVKAYYYAGGIYVLVKTGEIKTKEEFEKDVEEYYEDFSDMENPYLDLIYLCTPAGPKKMLYGEMRKNYTNQEIENMKHFDTLGEAEQWYSANEIKSWPLLSVDERKLIEWAKFIISIKHLPIKGAEWTLQQKEQFYGLYNEFCESSAKIINK